MSPFVTAIIVFICVFASSLLGLFLRKILPEHHLSSHSKDSVLLATGLVATLAALILGLLIASANDDYAKESDGITEMAAKVIFLDRVLANYGPEANDTRATLRKVVESIHDKTWPDRPSQPAQLDPSAAHTEPLFSAIQKLAPQGDLQTALKTQALTSSLELSQRRWLEFEQADTTISPAMLYILTFWLAVLFISFGMFSPPNGTVIISLVLAALSVAAAVFLLLELNDPFAGVIQISDTPFVDALQHLGR